MTSQQHSFSLDFVHFLSTGIFRFILYHMLLSMFVVPVQQILIWFPVEFECAESCCKPPIPCPPIHDI